MAQRSRIHPPVQETQETRIWSLGQEDPLEEEIATHSSILVRKIPWREEPGGYSPWGQKSQTGLNTHAVLQRAAYASAWHARW